MTAFIKSNFYINGDYVDYNVNGVSKFVARFKHARNSKSTFITFLIKNFTVEEYFSRTAKEAPLDIVRSKGYLQPHVKKLLKSMGYAVSTAGYNQYIADSVWRLQHPSN